MDCVKITTFFVGSSIRVTDDMWKGWCVLGVGNKSWTIHVPASLLINGMKKLHTHKKSNNYVSNKNFFYESLKETIQIEG